MRVFVSVSTPRALTALSWMSASSNSARSARPISSVPNTPTAVTRPESARTFAATFAPPPSFTSEDSWRTISTGASRLTRSVCP